MADKTILDAVTSTAPTGGTSQTYKETSEPNFPGVTYTNSSEASPLNREKLQVKVRPSSVNSAGEVVSKKVQMTLSWPIADATTGLVRYNSVRIELTVDPRDEAALIDNMRQTGAQLFYDADFDDTYNFGVE